MIHSLRLAAVLCGFGLVSSSPVPAQNAPASTNAGEAVILTPKTPPTPRINGAKVFGVRPGHPFLFTIPATGDRPMTFSAKGLPAGLMVDARPDRSRAASQKAGAYKVTLAPKMPSVPPAAS
jgi:hypothetical protein